MPRCAAWRARAFTLRGRINSMLYERTALSRKPEELAKKELEILNASGQVGPALILKDPYILDFLDLQDHYMEKDFEDAILRELELFIRELGAGFSFIARQKRIQLDGDDFYIDLLFYNRKLKRLVAIEFKQGSFKAEYKGQMELYLRWLAKYESEDAEGKPLGIILCAGASSRQIELLELDAAGIHVAEYSTVLPPRHVLERKLQDGGPGSLTGSRSSWAARSVSSWFLLFRGSYQTFCPVNYSCASLRFCKQVFYASC